MPKKMIISSAGKFREVDPEGRIEVTPGRKDFSNQWRLIGAVARSKPFEMPKKSTWLETDEGIEEIDGPDMGREVKRYTLKELQTEAIEWTFKNGEQKVHILDYDHGSTREWCNPAHCIILTEE